MNKQEIINELDVARDKEYEERRIMNKLAMESLNAGKSFSENELLLRQSRIVDDCTITVKKLEEMLDNLENEI